MATVEVLRGLGFRQAVETTKIAPVGQAHPQVPQDAAMRIGEKIGAAHLGGGALVVLGSSENGGMTLTEPSAFTSTFKS